MSPRAKKLSRKSLPKAEPTEQQFALEDVGVLQMLGGEADQQLRLLETLLRVRIARQPHGLSVSGLDADVELALDVLTQLTGIIKRGEALWPGDVERAVQIIAGNRRAQLTDLFRDQVRIAGRTHSVVPKTFNQKLYLEAIRTHDIVFGIGPAGTGKTYLAMAMAVAALLRREVRRVVLCRPAVEAGEKLGFLPGDMAEKVNPYLRPLYDALHDMVDFERARDLVERGNIEVAPLAFMRGRTLSDAFVILDEAQNTTSGQMKMLLTRLGRGAKCVITGDVTQIDLPSGVTSGLRQAERLLRNIEGIAFVNLTTEDVIRHPLIAAILKAYEKDEAAAASKGAR